jgi:galactosamine-6-phosphate isomerase
MGRVHHCRDYQDMSREAAARVFVAVAVKSDSLLCAAAGDSPAGLYQELIRESK